MSESNFCSVFCEFCPPPSVGGPYPDDSSGSESTIAPAHTMQRYELLAILPQHVTDTEVQTFAPQMTDKIRTAGATIIRESLLGRKKLAYKIKTSLHGSYVLVHFDMEPEQLNPLEHTLRLMPELLRFQIIKIPTKTEEQLARERALQEKLARQMTAAVHTEATASTAPIVQAPIETPAPQLSTEELSKKLDELLEKPEI